MKKLLSLLLVLTLSLTLFVGCGGKKKPQLYVLSFRVQDYEYYDWMNKQFEKKYDCKVIYDAVSTSEYPDVLISKLSTNSTDVFGTQPTYFGDEGIYTKMMSLDGMAFTDKIIDYAADQCKLDGSWKIAPLNIVTFLVFYNKTAFTRNNLSIPTTWNEFLDVCDALADDSKLTAPILYCGRDGWPINMITDSIEYPVVRAADPEYYLRVWKDGTQRFDEEGGLYEEYFSKAKELFNYVQDDSTGSQYSNVSRLFASGKFGMTIDGSWAYKDLMEAIDGDFEIGTFVLPASDKAENNTKAASKMGGGWSIHAKTQNEELAKAYIEFQMSDSVYQRYLDEIQMDTVVKNMKSSVAALKDIYRYDTVLTFENYKINGFVYNMESSYGPDFVSGTKKVSTILASLQSDCDSSKNIWNQTKNLNNWLRMMHPDKV